MTTIEDFPIREIVVDDDHEFIGVTVLHTTRPLFGTEVDTGLIGFSVLPPDDERLLARNLALDAHRIVFVAKTTALEKVREMIAREYPDADVDDISESELLAMYHV